MLSISQNGPEKQPPVLSYSYAFRASPEQIRQMNREQLQTLCIEQAFLLWLIISIIRNPLAAIATRVLAVDLIVSCVEKNIRGNLQSITERSRVYITGDGGIAKRLGVHANTVSKCFKNLERYQLIKRDYVYDEAKEREYLDITLSPMQLNQPMRLQDKTARKAADAGKKETAPQGNVSFPEQALVCPACESTDIIATCRTCGTSGDPADFTPQAQIIRIIDSVIEKQDPPTLLNKIYGDTNNAPQASAPLFTSQNQPEEEQQPEATSRTIEGVVQNVLDEMRKAPDMQQLPPTPGKQLAMWLRRRIGHGKIIYATGSPDSSKKYLAKPAAYQADLKAYLLGDKDHIYGSYLLRPDGTTYVLAFDFDIKEEALHDIHEDLLQMLAKAGASPVYWLRQNKRGHLELYFDSPVTPDAALAWCIAVCPPLADVEEVYPARDKRNNPISWPLYQRKGTTIFPCQAKAVLARNPDRVLAPMFSLQSLAALVSQALTPASLIPPPPTGPVQLSARAPAPEERPQQPALSDSDIARIVIAEYNRETTWEEIIALCGGANRDGKFNAVWRGETSNSVKVDADEQYACDYGRTAGYPKKLDKYEIYCLVNGGRDFKKTDLAARCKAYRQRQEQQPPRQEIPQETTQEGPQTDVRVPTDETPTQIVSRLRRDITMSQGYVITPKGVGTLWQLWPTRIGVVIEGEGRVSFFSELSDMRQIRAYDVVTNTVI